MADLQVDKKATSLDASDNLDGYSKVIIKTGEQDSEGNDIVYIAGNDTGRTLTINNPWGNQENADAILAKIQGWAYQPYEAARASVNPAFEIGDSVNVGNVFSGVYDSRIHFTKLFTTDIKAPYEEEIEHEYSYEDPKEKSYVRKINNAIARLNFFADSIEAKVDKVNENTTFGWRLTDSGWAVFNQNGNLFAVDANGASVTGEIKANTGNIGGFTIGSRGIYNNQSSFGGQEQTGVYIGTDGIQLGTRFRVDNEGNLYAASGTFDGNIYAKNIQYGGSAGYFSGSGILGSSLGTPQFMQGVINSLGFADFSNDVFNNRDTAQYVKCKWAVASSGVSSPYYYVEDPSDPEAGGSINRHTHYVTVSGNTVTIGAPDFTGTPHPFEIATSDNVTIQQNGVATYQSGYRRYAVPVVAKDTNGNVVASATLYVSASQAYDAGYTGGYSAGYNYAFDNCVIGYYYTSSWGSNNYYVIFANIDGQRAADASVYVDNNGHIND